MQILKSSFLLSIVNIISRTTGYIRDIFIAYFLGTGIYADIYSIACRIPFYFRTVLFEGTFNLATVPLLNEIKSHEVKKYFLLKLLKIYLIVFIPLIIFIEVFMPEVLLFFAPGFIGIPEYGLAVFIARISFVYLFFIILISFITALLNSEFSFSLAGSVHIILNIFIIFSLLISVNFNYLPITAIAWAILLSGLMQVFFLIFILKKKFKNFNFHKSDLKLKVKKFFLIIFPAVGIYGLINFNKYVAFYYASLEKSSLSYLYYSYRVMEIPVSIVSLSLSIVLLPTISEYINKNKIKEVLETQKKVLKYSLLLMIPAACGIFILSEIIIELLFQRGEFDIKSTQNTAIALKIFTIGLPAQALILVLLPYFFTIRKTGKILIYAFIAFLINYILIFLTVDIYSYKGLAFSLSMSSWIFTIFLIIEYKLINQNLIDKQVFISFIKYLIISCILSLYVFILNEYFINTNKYNSFILFVIILSAIILYIIFLYILEKKVVVESFNVIRKNNKYV